MEVSYIKKYQPTDFKEFDVSLQEAIETFLFLDNINLLLFGLSGSGKTTLINILIKKYYENCENYEKNVLYINNLQEQGVHYCRSEVKSFCQTTSCILNKKKMVIIDDLDSINEPVQHVFRNCIDKYGKNVHFIASCENTQKIIESMKSRLSIIKVPCVKHEIMNKIYNTVSHNENLQIHDDAKEFIIKVSENSIKTLLNYLEKIKLLNTSVDLEIVKKICSNVGYRECEIYSKLCLNKDLEGANKYILSIYNKGYSVIDILSSYFIFIKTTELVDEILKYEIIKLICKYITIFNEIHEDSIELIFFTNNIIKLFSGLI